MFHDDSLYPALFYPDSVGFSLTAACSSLQTGAATAAHPAGISGCWCNIQVNREYFTNLVWSFIRQLIASPS